MVFEPVVALLDANVLYPAPIRDILLSFADAGLFQPKWTKLIHEEWTRNLLANRPDLGKEALKKTVGAMNMAFPDALVRGKLVDLNQLDLPDADDRHVLAAAIKAGASHLVTANLKDFPLAKVREFNIAVVHPDVFLCSLIAKDKLVCLHAVRKMVARLRNPPMTFEDVLLSLSRCGLPGTAELLAK